MQIEMIRELAILMREQQINALEYQDDTTRIRLESGLGAPTAVQPAPPAAQAAMPNLAAPQANAVDPGLDFNEIYTVVSPMVGVFYAQAAPDQPPFVKAGGMVKKGAVLCIVEAMKVMNEIVAERDGQIVDVCVNNGDVVEFGQILFKLV